MKKRVIQGIYCSVLIMLALFSCKKDSKPLVIYVGYDYFPVNIGHYVIYNADSMYFNGLKWDTIDTYQIREVVDSKIGADTFRIARYRRLNADSQWVFQKYWKECLSSTEAVRDEDNVTYVNLIFPVKLYSSWNGGAFNSLTSWNESGFQYDSVNAPLTLNSVYFDSTLTVSQCYNQIPNQNLISYQYFLERYATNVGLISKELINVTAYGFTNPDPRYGIDSIFVIPDYFYLAQRNQLVQQSVVFSQTYVSSGNL